MLLLEWLYLKKEKKGFFMVTCSLGSSEQEETREYMLCNPVFTSSFLYHFGDLVSSKVKFIVYHIVLVFDPFRAFVLSLDWKVLGYI